MTPAQLLQRLLLGLYGGPGELELFAVAWLGTEYRPVGPWLAGAYAFEIVGILERMGFLRDGVWWDALVVEKPERESDIRAVERRFRSAPSMKNLGAGGPGDPGYFLRILHIYGVHFNGNSFLDAEAFLDGNAFLDGDAPRILSTAHYPPTTSRWFL